MRSVGALLSVLLVTSSVAAQEAAPAPPPADVALAEKLFVEGRVAAARGDHAAACARFDASRKLDGRAVGTIFNLAMCSEKLGRYASAVAFYREVVARDRERGTRLSRDEVSEARLAELEPRLSTLRVVVPPEADEPSLEIAIDGAPLSRDRWGTAMPIDGGEHVVTASAPRKITQRLSVLVEPDSAKSEVAVPALADEPIPPPPKPPVLAYTIGGVGVLALAVGVGFGIGVASECGGLLRDTCKGLDEASDADASSKERSLETRSIIATVATVAGIVGVGTGAVLLLTRKAPVAVSPAAFRGGGGLGLHGTF